MTARTRRRLIQIGSFVLAGLLLYLALRNVDFNEVGAALQQANYWWLLPLVVVTLLSHLARAWRWQVLLEALPDEALRRHRLAHSGGPVSLAVAFASLMIGYMVNYAGPRLGEVVRTANLANREKIPFSSVLGTVVVERILDVVVLVLGLASTFLLLLDRSDTMQDVFVVPIQRQLETVPLLALGAAFLVGTAFFVLVVRWALRSEDSRMRRLWEERVRPVVASFRDGLATVWRSPRRGVLVVSTLLMWFCYALMAYLPFHLLHMVAPYGLSLLDGWCIMILGAVGVAIPSPGGVGTYHYITIQTLVLLFGVAEAPAATYAVLGHAAQLVLYVLVGVICLIWQGTSLGAVRGTAQQIG